METFQDWLLLYEGSIKTHVPTVRQEEKFSCGASVVKALFEYFKVSCHSEKQLINLLKTNERDGTRTINIIKICREYGLKTKARYNMTFEELKKYLDSKKPVITCIQAWGNKKKYKDKKSGHYVIAIGYDKDNVYFQDPSTGKGMRGYIPWNELRERWKDMDTNGGDRTRYGIVVWKEGGIKKAEIVNKSVKIK